MSLQLKSRKLYQVRNHPNDGTWLGKQVGHKGRLLPYSAAMQVAQRLRSYGLFITVDPILVNLTPEQDAFLKRRYAKG